jgi:hypothetical protein
MAVAARVVRRSLKEDKRLLAERRGEMDLRFAKWEVRYTRPNPSHTKKPIPRHSTDTALYSTIPRRT